MCKMTIEKIYAWPPGRSGFLSRLFKILLKKMAARNFTRICLILSLLTSLVNGIHDIRHQRLRPRSLTDEVSNAPEALITDVPRIGSGSSIEQQSTEQIKLFRRENEDLKSKLEEMLDVRLALIHALYGSEPKIARRQTTTPLDLSKENQELQQGLDSLNSAFASLYNILAKQLPVCLENDKGGSSENTAGSNNQGLSTIYQVTVYSTTGTTVSRTIRSTVLVIPPTPSSQPAVSPSRTSPTYSNGTSTRTKGISSSATDLVAPIPSSVPATSTGASADMNPGTNPDTSPGTAPGTNPGLSSGDSTFDPDSTSNVAVYYGQSNITSSIRLDSLCADPSIDIVILAFVTSFDTGNGYPALDLSGSGCWSASSSQQIAGAEGLLDCTVNVAPQIQTCQNLGKKVLLSIGGYTGRAVIPDEQSASTYAETLWDLFGEGTGLEELRPFGNASVDGFDIGKNYLIALSLPYPILPKSDPFLHTNRQRRQHNRPLGHLPLRPPHGNDLGHKTNVSHRRPSMPPPGRLHPSNLNAIYPRLHLRPILQ